MQLEPNPDNQSTDGEAPQPEEGATSSNRTFILLAIPLVLVFLCIAGALGYYALVFAPQQRHSKETQVANVIMQNNTQIAIQTAAARQPTATIPPTLPPPTDTPVPPPTDTPVPTVQTPQAGAIASPTPLLAGAPSDTPVAAPTNTVVKTPAGAAVSSPTPLGSPVKTSTPGKSPTPLVGGLKTATPTQLPGTGFADEAGVPALIVVALGLVAVAVVVRRLRLSLR